MVTRQQATPPRTRGRRAVAVGVLLVALLAAGLPAVLREGPTETPLPARPPGLGDLWAGRAALVLDRKWTSAGLGEPAGSAWGGSHVEIVDGTWYLFNRVAQPQGCPSRPGFKAMGTQVRSSPDRGGTWGPPTLILGPTPGTAWACAATDGDAVYDAEAGTWRYLFQCLGDSGGWAGCYAERQAPDPFGAFVPPPGGANPVLTSGSLWGRICRAAADTCHRPANAPQVGDEGTFDVFARDGDGWWVGFHGYDGERGYRGIARTDSFQAGDWSVDGDDGTPDDAVLGPADAARWRESWSGGSSIGAGAASILPEGDWYYQLAEFADVNLGCTPGQNWDLGLFRARRLSSTDWASLPAGNPLVYSSRAPAADGKPAQCNVGYPRLFREPATGTTYLMHGRRSADPNFDGIYVYRLAWDRNLLGNGDLRTADGEDWQRLPGTPTQLSVERLPDRSPDGTAYMAFNCGAPACDGSGAVFQDVRVDPEEQDGRFAFGGTFRAEAGTVGLEVSVLQLDADEAIVANATVPVTAGAAYVGARGTFELDDRAATLRFQLTPRAAGTLWADNLYLIPQEGCSTPDPPTC